MTAGISIRPLATQADYDACVELQRLTWGRDFNERVPSAVLRLAQHLGGIASGAFDVDSALLGFIFGMTGVREGRLVHWSDMLAVRPDARDRGLGEALKRHQRDELVARGITRVYWTFDPLEARNAWLNFARLGARADEYVRDCYANSDSPLHAGLPTDRLIVHWQLDDARTADRLAGRTRAPSMDEASTIPVINPPGRAARHGAVAADAAVAIDCADARTDLDAALLLLAIPARIQAIKAEDPSLAMRWRHVTRTAFEAYLPRGYSVTDASRGEAWTGLVLERTAGSMV